MSALIAPHLQLINYQLSPRDAESWDFLARQWVRYTLFSNYSDRDLKRLDVAGCSSLLKNGELQIALIRHRES